MTDIHPLAIAVSRPRELSQERRARWARVLEAFQEPFSASSVVFLAETLELLDGGAPCSFEGSASVGDMGAEEVDLRLSTGRLGIVHVVDRHYDSSELKVVGNFRHEVFGFPLGGGLDWNGLFLEGSTRVDLEGVGAVLKEALLALAGALFEEVETRWGGDPPTPADTPPEKCAAKLAVREPLREGVALMEVAFDDGVFTGEWAQAVFRSRDDAEEYCRLLRISLGRGGGGRCWRQYELRGVRGGKPEPRGSQVP